MSPEQRSETPTHDRPGGAGFYAALDDVARSLGFAALGVVEAEPQADLAGTLRERQQAGTYPLFCPGDVQLRTEPERWLAGCRSLWIAALPYRPPAAVRLPRPRPQGARPGGPAGRIAAYALPEDYHHAMRRRLRSLVRWASRRTGLPRRRHFRILVDTGPPVERHLWRLSGAGWIGKNTCAYAPGSGSWAVLGVVATTLPPPPEAGAAATPGLPERRAAPELIDPCAGCNRCVEACPTGALRPYVMDPRRCIAQFSQRPGPLRVEQEGRQLHGWLFGCDVCQMVCPHNTPDRAPLAFGSSLALEPAPGASGTLPLAEVLAMTPAAFRARYGATAVAWRSLSLLQRNAAFVAGQALRRPGRKEEGRILQELLARLAEVHPSPAVRDACASALGRPSDQASGAPEPSGSSSSSA
ncbi:MAG: DUF1730 domain-containing protein [Limnochordaceae bacterium]|nr:DUF1730 domain-containing protein [Limnochordaceae bacterium]